MDNYRSGGAKGASKGNEVERRSGTDKTRLDKGGGKKKKDIEEEKTRREEKRWH